MIPKGVQMHVCNTLGLKTHEKNMLKHFRFYLYFHPMPFTMYMMCVTRQWFSDIDVCLNNICPVRINLYSDKCQMLTFVPLLDLC